MNSVQLVGRLTKDIDMNFAAGSGMAIGKFTLAVNRMKKDDEADFINCIAFGKTAETMAQYLTKGRQISVNGNIRTGSYDAKDGTKRYTTDVVVEKFGFIGGQGNSESTQNNNQQTTSNHGNQDDDMIPDDDGNIPF